MWLCWTEAHRTGKPQSHITLGDTWGQAPAGGTWEAPSPPPLPPALASSQGLSAQGFQHEEPVLCLPYKPSQPKLDSSVGPTGKPLAQNPLSTRAPETVPRRPPHPHPPSTLPVLGRTRAAVL